MNWSRYSFERNFPRGTEQVRRAGAILLHRNEYKRKRNRDCLEQPLGIATLGNTRQGQIWNKIEIVALGKDGGKGSGWKTRERGGRREGEEETAPQLQKFVTNHLVKDYHGRRRSAIFENHHRYCSLFKLHTISSAPVGVVQWLRQSGGRFSGLVGNKYLETPLRRQAESYLPFG